MWTEPRCAWLMVLERWWQQVSDGMRGMAGQGRLEQEGRAWSFFISMRGNSASARSHFMLDSDRSR